jgi:hypothetical protein
MDNVAMDGSDLAVATDGQHWRVAWHAPADPPPGTPHGAAAVCVTGDRIVLVSSDGQRWSLPGGRLTRMKAGPRRCGVSCVRKPAPR